MAPIQLEDVLGRDRYALQRDAIRQRLIAHKRGRRLSVGEHLTFVFEDRVTVWYQTQEMLWIEHITDLDAIRTELAVYNQLLPGTSELSTTLFVEIEEQSRIREELHRLAGIDEHVILEVGTQTIRGVFEPGRQTEEKLSAVQYVRFSLTDAARAAVVAGVKLALATDHPNYRARAEFPEPLRAALAGELARPESADVTLRRVRDGV